jgi:hypothetical protein
MVGEIASVYRSLSPAERETAVILTSNYGEAGAVDRYGPALGLPTAYSGHNSFWWWGPPPEPRGATIAVGFDPAYLRPYFGNIELAGRLRNGFGVQDDEEGQPVWICRDARQAWAEIWPSLRHYG